MNMSRWAHRSGRVRPARLHLDRGTLPTYLGSPSDVRGRAVFHFATVEEGRQVAHNSLVLLIDQVLGFKGHAGTGMAGLGDRSGGILDRLRAARANASAGHTRAGVNQCPGM